LFKAEAMVFSISLVKVTGVVICKTYIAGIDGFCSI